MPNKTSLLQTSFVWVFKVTNFKLVLYEMFCTLNILTMNYMDFWLTAALNDVSFDFPLVFPLSRGSFELNELERLKFDVAALQNRDINRLTGWSGAKLDIGGWLRLNSFNSCSLRTSDILRNINYKKEK